MHSFRWPGKQDIPDSRQWDADITSAAFSSREYVAKYHVANTNSDLRRQPNKNSVRLTAWYLAASRVEPSHSRGPWHRRRPLTTEVAEYDFAFFDCGGFPLRSNTLHVSRLASLVLCYMSHSLRLSFHLLEKIGIDAGLDRASIDT